MRMNQSNIAHQNTSKTAICLESDHLTASDRVRCLVDTQVHSPFTNEIASDNVHQHPRSSVDMPSQSREPVPEGPNHTPDAMCLRKLDFGGLMDPKTFRFERSI